MSTLSDFIPASNRPEADTAPDYTPDADDQYIDFQPEADQPDSDTSLGLFSHPGSFQQQETFIEPHSGTKKSWSLGRKISITIVLLCLGLMVFGGVFIFAGSNNLNDVFTEGGSFDIGQLLGGQRAELQGESDGRTNILMIGKDEEAGLADTLIVGSYYYDEQKLATISLPRDFKINDGFSTTKINSVYSFAQQRYELGQSDILPEQFMANLIGEELDIPIHYWGSVNFEGVEQVVDVLGGITVDVENSFTDCQYPNDNYGFIRPCPQFIAGPTNMNGETALIFARSRKSFDNPAEALDFARSRRQQLVIQAIINKAKSEVSAGNIALNPAKLNEYLTVVGNNVRISVKPNEVLSFYEIFQKADDITNQKYRFAADFESGIICEEFVGSSDLVYCDGNIGGLRYAGSSKLELRRIAQNLLAEMETQALTEIDVAIIGNVSDLTITARQAFVNSNYINITYDNTFAPLTAATATSLETATIYIPNDQLRSQFERSTQPDFAFEIGTTLPNELIGSPYASSSIVVVVKTVE